MASSAPPLERRRLLNASAVRLPPVRPDALPRTRLAPLRAMAQRGRVVLVSAPAGYGKSTVVAQWCDLDPRVSGWVQLANGDNDPVALVAHVAAALEPTGAVRDDLLDELSRRAPRIVEVALPLLAADLSERDPFVLVLDDVDLVTAKRSRSIIQFLTEQVPSELSVGVGRAWRSGSAARPPPCRWRSGRGRGRAPCTGRRGDASRCRPRWSGAVRAGGRGSARADGGVGCRGRAGSPVVARPRRCRDEGCRTDRHSAADRRLSPGRGDWRASRAISRCSCLVRRSSTG